jgi:hypothetical protein
MLRGCIGRVRSRLESRQTPWLNFSHLITLNPTKDLRAVQQFRMIVPDVAHILVRFPCCHFLSRIWP